MNLAYRWFCRLGLEGKVPDHSTFSVNRHGRFRDSDILRRVFESVVRGCMDAGLVGGQGFAVDASVIEADAVDAREPGYIRDLVGCLGRWLSGPDFRVGRHVDYRARNTHHRRKVARRPTQRTTGKLIVILKYQGAALLWKANIDPFADFEVIEGTKCRPYLTVANPDIAVDDVTEE